MKPLFTETQQFRQWWLWGILLISSCIPIYILFNDENKSLTSTDGIFTLIIITSVILMMWFTKLETVITTKTIQVKYFPFVNKTFQMEEIEFMKVIYYGFVGGWGIRLWTSYGTVYNTSGSKGLHIQLKNGKRYVIGTQKPDELKKVIDNLNS